MTRPSTATGLELRRPSVLAPRPARARSISACTERVMLLKSRRRREVSSGIAPASSASTSASQPARVMRLKSSRSVCSDANTASVDGADLLRKLLPPADLLLAVAGDGRLPPAMRGICVRLLHAAYVDVPPHALLDQPQRWRVWRDECCDGEEEAGGGTRHAWPTLPPELLESLRGRTESG